jgi:hypothetical protein
MMPRSKGGFNQDISKYENLRISEDSSDLIGSRGVFTLFRGYPDIHPVSKNNSGIYLPTEAIMGNPTHEASGGFGVSDS